MKHVTRLLLLGRVSLGVLAVGITVYWASVSVPTIAESATRGRSADAATIVQPTPRTASGSPQSGTEPWPVDPTGRTITDMGCADDLGAESINEQRMGPIVGWDNPHIYEIDDHRTLWIAHDTYVDHDGNLTRLGDTRPQMQNVVFLQEGTCFRLLHGGTETERLNFEIGDGHDNPSRFLWPLGGAIDGNRIWIFWNEMVESPEPVVPGGGIVRHPVSTWLASYDVDTLERLSFDRAPADGVFPTYGFAVETDDEFSYLFANTNLLNFAREGGFENGPHSATKMYLARVPKGQLDQPPVYWDGSGWSSDSQGAEVISQRFWAENTIQPRYIDGRWVSVVKRDGFFGNEIVVDRAEHPWGPWVEVERIAHEGRVDPVAPRNSYHPVIAPWSSAENGLVVIVSENTQDWDQALAAIDMYRPSVLHTDWPFPDDTVTDERTSFSAAADAAGS